MPRPAPSLERKISDLMQDLHRSMHTRLSHSGIPSEELTLRQIRALHLVRQRPGMTMGEMATEFRITKASVNALINRLCRDGWLTRAQDTKDRRITRLRLTATAETNIRKTLNRKRSIFASLLSALSPSDQKTFLRLLKTLHHSLNS